MEVRARLGAGRWQVLLPGGGVSEVEPAGAVQGLLGRADRQGAWQHRVLVAVGAGQVDSEPPQAGRAGIPQPAQRQRLALHNTNPNPLVEGPTLLLAPVHGKV